jgi:hypothetical protein
VGPWRMAAAAAAEEEEEEEEEEEGRRLVITVEGTLLDRHFGGLRREDRAVRVVRPPAHPWSLLFRSVPGRCCLRFALERRGKLGIRSNESDAGVSWRLIFFMTRDQAR